MPLGKMGQQSHVEVKVMTRKYFEFSKGVCFCILQSIFKKSKIDNYKWMKHYTLYSIFGISFDSFSPGNQTVAWPKSKWT